MEKETIVSKLLAFDRADIERKRAVHPMALSKFGGQVFEFELVEMDAEQACKVQDKSLEFERATGMIFMRSWSALVATIMAGCPSVFRNQEVRKHYGCNTFEELVKVLLTKGEAQELADAIDGLSDVDPEDWDFSADELKNS